MIFSQQILMKLALALTRCITDIIDLLLKVGETMNWHVFFID